MKAIFLCDLTGIMAEPWLRAGYECYLFDAQHPPGVTKEGLLFKVGGMLHQPEDVWQIIQPGSGVRFCFAFPECTDLAVSGNGHIEAKKMKNPQFREDAMRLVYLCRDTMREYGRPWALENPVSVVSTLWRKPDFKFDPFIYGGYLPEDDVHPIYPDYFPPRDAYYKPTCLWAGGGFQMPQAKPVKPMGEYIHRELGGRSQKTKNIRSATPRGFAEAVFLANGA